MESQENVRHEFLELLFKDFTAFIIRIYFKQQLTPLSSRYI